MAGHETKRTVTSLSCPAAKIRHSSGGTRPTRGRRGQVVDQQEREEQEDAGAGVIGERDRDPAGRWSGRSARPAPPATTNARAARAAPRLPVTAIGGRAHRDDQVDQRQGHVQGNSVDAKKKFDNANQRKLERVKGDIAEDPAVQQQVTVHHVPGLQDVIGRIGGDVLGQRDPQQQGVQRYAADCPRQRRPCPRHPPASPAVPVRRPGRFGARPHSTVHVYVGSSIISAPSGRSSRIAETLPVSRAWR